MMRIAWLLMLVAALGLMGCKGKPKAADEEVPEQAASEPRTVQIEEQRVKVMTDPDEVKKEVESTIEAGIKARERQMGE